MNTRRVISSREPDLDIRLTKLFDILYFLRDVLDKNHQDFPNDEEILLNEIGSSAVEVALELEERERENGMLIGDLTAHTISNSILEHENDKLRSALIDLSNSSQGHQIEVNKSLIDLVRHSCSVRNNPNTQKLEYVFEVDALDEGLKDAIDTYLYERISKLII